MKVAMIGLEVFLMGFQVSVKYPKMLVVGLKLVAVFLKVAYSLKIF